MGVKIEDGHIIGMQVFFGDLKRAFRVQDRIHVHPKDDISICDVQRGKALLTLRVCGELLWRIENRWVESGRRVG